jgi:hypothetical protein
MASTAEIDENNIVLRVCKVPTQADDDTALTEQWAADFWGGTWKKCAFGAPSPTLFRKNYPGAGYAWRADLDAFIAPQPSDDYTLDETTCQWKGPSPDPSYAWNGYAWTPPVEPGPPPP